MSSFFNDVSAKNTPSVSMEIDQTPPDRPASGEERLPPTTTGISIVNTKPSETSLEINESADMELDTPSGIASHLTPEDNDCDALSLKSHIHARPFNTTSTVIAASTVTNPDMEQIFFTLGCVLQAQIVEDDKLPMERKLLHRTFDIVPDIKEEYGGVPEKNYTEEELDIDAQNDPVLRGKLEQGRVPLVDTIVRFMKLLHQCGKYSVECNIVALVYLNRMSNAKHLALTVTNWRAVWLTCIMIAQKMWDDKPLKTSAFAQLVPPISKGNLKDFELKALQLLDFTISVKPSLYVKYYFELRDLFVSIIGFKESDWQVKPLSIRNAKRMEALAERSLRLPPSTPCTPMGTPANTPKPTDTPMSVDKKSLGSTLDDNDGISSSSRFVLS